MKDNAIKTGCSFDSFYYCYKMNLTSEQGDLLLLGEEKEKDSFFHQYIKIMYGELANPDEFSKEEIISSLQAQESGLQSEESGLQSEESDLLESLENMNIK